MPPDSSSTQAKAPVEDGRYRPSPAVAAIVAEWMPEKPGRTDGPPRNFPRDMLHMQLALLALHQAGMDDATRHRAAQTAAYLERELMAPGQGGYYHPTEITHAP